MHSDSESSDEDLDQAKHKQLTEQLKKNINKFDKVLRKDELDQRAKKSKVKKKNKGKKVKKEI